MKQPVWLYRDPASPRVYRLMLNVESSGEALLGIPLWWREARKWVTAEAYYDMCRMSFEDWCDRNPHLLPADGLDDV